MHLVESYQMSLEAYNEKLTFNNCLCSTRMRRMLSLIYAAQVSLAKGRVTATMSVLTLAPCSVQQCNDSNYFHLANGAGENIASVQSNLSLLRIVGSDLNK